MNNQYRQGDVLLLPVGKLDPGATRAKNEDRIVLAYGETTHAHTISGIAATLFVHGNTRLLQVWEPTELSHEEHSPLVVEPGVYQIVIQREFSPRQSRMTALD